MLLVADVLFHLDGGALEAGWVINTAEKGIRIDCACAQMAAVSSADSYIRLSDAGLPRAGTVVSCRPQPCRKAILVSAPRA